MILRIKKEYLSWSVGGGSFKEVKLSNLPKSKWQELYDLGFKEFFEVETPIEVETIIEKNDIEDDTDK